MIGQWAWIDDDHLAFTMYTAGQWQVLYLTPDGEVGEVTEQVDGQAENDPIVVVQH